MKKVMFLNLICFLLSINLSAQMAELSGKVTEQKSKDPVLFGAVTLYQNGILIIGTETDFDGNYRFSKLTAGTYDVEISYIGFQTRRIEGVFIQAGKAMTLNIELSQEGVLLEQVVVKAYKVPLVERDNTTCSSTIASKSSASRQNRRTQRKRNVHPIPAIGNHNEYSSRTENAFVKARKNNFSTFGIDVDRASYSIVRTYLNRNALPPVDAVRAEEMINYFSYDYPQPTDDHPFAVHTEWATCPWNKDHLLLSVALQGERSDIQDMPPSNLTFLLDVSGSMGSPNKLPLVKSSMRILLDQLKPEDKVSIVVYAGAAGLVLPPTPIAQKQVILQALENLKSGGSTAGGAGIQLAYKTAREQFIPDGNNRIILATDGDFNIGINNVDDLEKLIEKERESGVFLTVLGFGMGNLKDNRMERLADKGNGMYSYIDTEAEARKVFELELTASLYTIAKDVKLQLQFNSREIAKYRLIGYENRMLNKEDFDDDTKDAGELGAGHSVTALYEVIPTRTLSKPVKLELRYKRPLGRKSFLLEREVAQEIVPFEQASDNLQWAAAVASYAMLLTDSPYQGVTSFEAVHTWAMQGLGADHFGFRRAFVNQVDLTEELKVRLGAVD